MVEHDGHNAVFAEYASAFEECFCHHCFVELVCLDFCFFGLGLVIISVAVGVCDGFVIIFAEIVFEPLWFSVFLGTFEPDVEEVGKFGVLDIIGIGGVEYYGGHAMVFYV